MFLLVLFVFIIVFVFVCGCLLLFADDRCCYFSLFLFGVDRVACFSSGVGLLLIAFVCFVCF